MQVDALDKIKLVRGVVPALIELADTGYRFVMVTNQDGLGTASFAEDDFQACQDFVISMFESRSPITAEFLVSRSVSAR